MNSKKHQNICALCERNQKLTFHHLIPKKMHTKKVCLKQFSKEEMHTRGIYICSPCHRAIHSFINHKQLALNYNTKKALLTHPKLSKFVKWVSKQTKNIKR